MDQGEEELSLGQYMPKTPSREPFLPSQAAKRRTSVGKFPLILTEEHGGIPALLFGSEEERKIGYIFAETGYLDFDDGSCPSSSYDGVYDAIRFVTKTPIALKSGAVIPPCSIKLSVESFIHHSKPTYTRRDHKRRFRLLWERSDLSYIVPTCFFVRENTFASLTKASA